MLLCLFFSLLPALIHVSESLPNPLPDEILFHNLNIDDGLAANNVIAIAQDNDGFMWFGTENGLNRYDGYEFSTFGGKNKKSFKDIGASNIRSFCSTNKNHLWIGSEKLIRYDYTHDRFTSYDISNGMGIRVIRYDSKGNLWLGGERIGLRKFNPTSEQQEGSYYQSSSRQALISDSINDLLIHNDGKIWIASDSGLYLFDPATEQLTRPFQHDLIDTVKITSLATDTENHLWIGTWQGLYRYNFLTGEVTDYLADPGSSSTIQHNQIHSILCDSNGNIWIGTDKHGIAVYEVATHQFKHYEAGNHNPYLLGGGAVFSLYEDRDRGIWIGIQGFGVYRFDPTHQVFKLYTSNPSNPDMLNHPMVLSIEEGGMDDLWVATDGGGLNRFFRNAPLNTPKNLHYNCSPTSSNSLSSDSIIGLAWDEMDNNLWIGTWAGGLNKYSPKTDTFTHWRGRHLLGTPLHQSPHTDELISDNIFKLYIDTKRQLWVSTWDAGIQVIDLKTDKVTKTLLGNPTGAPFSMLNNNIMAILEDRDGIMWFGGYNGLDRYDPKNNTFKNYNAKDTDVFPLTSNTIFALHQSASDQIWVATDQGLNLFNPQNGRFTPFNISGSFANNSIVGILEDDAGSLWLSTRHGLSRFTPETTEVRNYFSNEGLQSNEFNRFAYKRLKSGELVFGGVNGFNIFDPAVASQALSPPKVALTNLLLFNKPVEVEGRKHRLAAVINQASQITLAPNDNTISLTFSAMEYGTSGSIMYRYRLDGADADWLVADPSHRIATYTHLKHGQYNFRVQSKHPNSIWGLEKQIIISVTPHWWENWPFRLFSIVVAILVVYALFSSHIKRIKTKLNAQQRQKEILFTRNRNVELGQMNEELEALAQKKEDLLHLVAHDLRNPLTGIQLSVDMLTHDTFEISPEAENETLKNIDKMVSRMILTINSSLEENDPKRANKTQQESIQVNHHVGRIIKEHQIIASKKAIEIDFSTALGDNVAIMGYRFAFHQILDNLISNAIKFSYPQTIISILCRQSGKMVEIAITDQGQGMTEEDKKVIFVKRAKTTAKPTGGEPTSGIGLFNAKWIVEKMNGTIGFFSDGKAQGSTFFVRFSAHDSREEK